MDDEIFVDFNDGTSGPMPQPAKKLVEATRQFRLLEPTENLFDNLCKHIANGGDAINYLHINTFFGYAKMMRWIAEDKDRRKMYEIALADRNEWLVQRLLSELKMLSLSDIAGMYDDNGCLKPVSEIPVALRRAIASIETDEIFQKDPVTGTMLLAGYTKKVKLWNKQGALDSFMKHLGMFIERLEMKKTVEILVKPFDVEERIQSIMRNRLQGIN